VTATDSPAAPADPAMGTPAQSLAQAGLGLTAQAFLDQARVQRRLAQRTLSMYHDALVRLERSALSAAVALPDVRSHHLRRWAAELHAQGLGSRSIAIHPGRLARAVPLAGP
jgi:integrase/recombinase XerC